METRNTAVVQYMNGQSDNLNEIKTVDIENGFIHLFDKDEDIIAMLNLTDVKRILFITNGK